MKRKGISVVLITLLLSSCYYRCDEVDDFHRSSEINLVLLDADTEDNLLEIEDMGGFSRMFKFLEMAKSILHLLKGDVLKLMIGMWIT